MLKGFREFLAQGDIVDLAVAVVIGTAFTALVKAFTDSVIQPLLDRVGAHKGASYGFLKIPIGWDDKGVANQFVDFSAFITAAINFVIVAAVIYFLVVLPYNKFRKRMPGYDKDKVADSVKEGLKEED